MEPKKLAIINDKLKNPIYETLQLLNIKIILTKSNFSKKEGFSIRMVWVFFNYFCKCDKV